MPKAHVAAEFEVSILTAATWVARYLDEDKAGLADRPLTSHRSRDHTRAEIVEFIRF